MMSRDPGLRVMQIVTLAMVGGTFTVFLTFLFVRLGNPVAATPSMLAIVGLVTGVGGLILSAVLPRLIRQQQLERMRATAAESPGGDANRQIANTYIGSHMVKVAILESAAIINLVLFLVEPNWIPVGAALVCIACLACQFPTEATFGNRTG